MYKICFLCWHSENSMNNLLSYCGLVDARISGSEKDLPLLFLQFIIWLIDWIILFIRYENGSYFWCWSRKDIDETDLKQMPIILNFREEGFMPFSTSFFYNQTTKSIKCNSHEDWAENWIDVSDLFHPPEFIRCPTNVFDTIVYFSWEPWNYKM